MADGPNLAVRFSKPDKAALREVAMRLCGGNQSETLRVLVRTTLEVLKEQDAKGKVSSSVRGRNRTPP